MVMPNEDANLARASADGKNEDNGSGRDADIVSIPLLTLPRRVPQQVQRPTQSNIPDDRAIRDRLKKTCAQFVEQNGLVPPLAISELHEHTVSVRNLAGVADTYDDYISVLVSNAAWRDHLAQIPFERRLLLVPKCLRAEEVCPAPFDEFGLLCKECGLCSLHDLTVEAERLGYAVLVAEGSAIVRSMIETGRIEAIVGVSCLNVLEKCFPHLEATAVPGIAIPLLQDDCVNTSVDLDWVWDVIHLTSDDRTYRMDLNELRDRVRNWFGPDRFERLLGPCEDETSFIARKWLATGGKRWRPYLTTCVYLAMTGDQSDEEPVLPDDLKKLAIAVECFHKASLIHDDIEDDDERRYGEPTLHAEYGMPVALNVGDFLLGEGYRLIGELDVAAEMRVAMLQVAAGGHLTLSRGQGAELAWMRHPRPLSSLEVLEIFRKKTAPAFDVALQLGACLGGADDDVHSTLAQYSESIGIAYQIRDDLEDYTGQSDSHDLRDLRPSVLLSIARRRASGDSEKALLERLWNKEVSYDDVADELDRIFEQRGVIKKAGELQQAYTEEAVRSLSTLSNATLKGLLRRVVGKIFGDNLIEGYCSEFEARNASGREARSEPAA